MNASRADEDFAWLQKHLGDNGTLENRSADYGGLAIQGPRIVELLQLLVGEDAELPARNQIRDFDWGGTRLTIARTGYTGEDGVEVFFAARDAAKVWNAILEKGKDLEIRPCGLGAVAAGILEFAVERRQVYPGRRNDQRADSRA